MPTNMFSKDTLREIYLTAGLPFNSKGSIGKVTEDLLCRLAYQRDLIAKAVRIITWKTLATIKGCDDPMSCLYDLEKLIRMLTELHQFIGKVNLYDSEIPTSDELWGVEELKLTLKSKLSSARLCPNSPLGVEENAPRQRRITVKEFFDFIVNFLHLRRFTSLLPFVALQPQWQDQEIAILPEFTHWLIYVYSGSDGKYYVAIEIARYREYTPLISMQTYSLDLGNKICAALNDLLQ